ILLSIYTSSSAHTIKSLAEDLVISKPAICRAIDALSIIGLVKRKRDTKDKRIIYLQRTVKGSVFLSEFAETIKTSLAKHI
ncbi:MAG: MarR family transcriptional regulator, partial [Pseudomonadota bacterium]